AEDGIRDFHVTGVQTCALPILGVPPHQVAKTLIMEDEQARPLIVIMHGDCEVSTKNLARQTGAKKIGPCAPDTAQRHSGYQVGEIGRASCRERVSIAVVAVRLI